METRVFSAYNLARGVLLNSKLAVADSGNQPLKLLDIVVSGMGMDATAALWLNPLLALPAIPRVFPFDLVYLDKDYRVLETAEMGPGIDFPPFHFEIVSALVLPPDTLRRTQTASGDRMIVCPVGELEALLAASATNLEPAPVASARSAIGIPASIIELTPEKQHVSATAPLTRFERSILSAVSKASDAVAVSASEVSVAEMAVAETAVINPQDPSPALRQPESRKRVEASTGQFTPGPSIDITEAFLEHQNKVRPAIIEHHIDPEDLFSNWVVSTPAPPSSAPMARPLPPAPSIAVNADKPEIPEPKISDQESAPEPVRQSAKKPSASARAGAATTPSRAAVPDSPSPSAPPKVKAAAAASDKPAPLPKSKPSPPVKTQAASAPRPAFPQAPTANTFTTVPYGMWQVSMPTAMAPLPKVNPPAKSPSGPTSRNGLKQPKSQQTPAAEASPEAAAPSAPPKPSLLPPQPQPQSATPSVSKSEPGIPSAIRSESNSLSTAAKPIIPSPSNTEPHAPGDFLAALQEKLQRAQQAKPISPPESPHQNSLVSPPSGDSPIADASVPVRTTKPSTAPANSSLASALPSTVPASKPAKVDPKPIARPAGSPPAINAKTEAPLSTFRAKFKHWFNPTSQPSDRRRAGRRYVPGMVAHYFTGGAPKPHDVADISMSGMYLLTDDRWMPGTMIQMTLQKPCAKGERKQSMNILSRIVRRGSDGVAIEFIMPEALSHVSHDIQPSQATDKFALARFI